MVSISCLGILSGKPTLEYLSLNLTHLSDLPRSSLSQYLTGLSRRSLFPSIRVLHLSTVNIVGIGEFIETIASDRLLKLVIQYGFPAGVPDDIFRLTDKLRCFPSLKRITLESNHALAMDGGPSKRILLASTLIRSSLQLRELREVYLCLSMNVDLDDEFMLDLAESMPALKELTIESLFLNIREDTNLGLGITLDALVLFMECCEHLRKLEIPINIIMPSDEHAQLSLNLRDDEHGLAQLSTFETDNCSQSFYSEVHQSQVLVERAVRNFCSNNVAIVATCAGRRTCV